jgi:uncharacterized protein YciI
MSKTFVITRYDRGDGQAEAIRARTRPAHGAYMKSLGARVRAGGPLLDAQGQPCGGFMIFEAASEAAVRAMLAADPFESGPAPLSDRIDIAEIRWQTHRPADLPPLP